MKNILIVGATGFIGRNLFEFFCEKQNYNIQVLNRKDLDMYSDKAVEEYLKCKFYDVIIFCANDSSVRNPDIRVGEMTYYNLRLVLNFERCSKYYGKLFYLGSGAEYDKRFDIACASEDMIANHVPADEYGLYKYTVNKIIENSENWYNLRLFGIFGKYEDWKTKFISGLCCKAIKGLPLTIRQDTRFDYLWIEDFCRIVEILIQKDNIPHSMNVVRGEDISLVELTNIVKDISNKDLPVYIAREGTAKIYTASNRIMLKTLGDFKYTDIKASITNLYEWYKENEQMIDLYSLLYQ